MYHNSLVYPFSYGSFEYRVCERNKDSDTSKEQKVKIAGYLMIYMKHIYTTSPKQNDQCKNYHLNYH